VLFDIKKENYKVRKYEKSCIEKYGVRNVQHYLISEKDLYFGTDIPRIKYLFQNKDNEVVEVYTYNINLVKNNLKLIIYDR
jgi:hypothetical protein